MIAQFTEPIECAYRDILRELKKKRPDLASLSKRYQQIQARDTHYEDVGKALLTASPGATTSVS